ncbi:response regulator [Deinococcus hohokamensis]|uniref:Response regulator n=1 Tax=Deinococcus hohokamensis TaxID=309883 RepID=A0ABV9IF96_9DEIO
MCLPGGREALRQLRAETYQPGGMLVSRNMPGMNGFQVLEAIKADPKLRKLPVVILSTSSVTEDIDLAYHWHARSYLVTLSGFGAFLKQIKAVLKDRKRVQRSHP